MAIIGPRVGGAHVDVNLKFDPRSTQTIGRQIHRQLARIGERNSRVYRRIGHDAVTAWRTALGTIVASAPHMGSAISAVAASATMLAGALHSSVQAAAALGPVIGALGVAAGTAALGLRGMSDAISAASPAELAKALKNLTPSARASALAIRGLRDEATKLRKVVQERMFAGLSGEISRLANTVFPVLEVGLGKMADSLNGLFKSLLQYANSAAGLEQVGQVLDNSADIFDRLAQAAVPFLDGLLRLFNALSPAAKRMADRIADAGRSFQSWTQAEGFGNRIDSMMKRAEKTAGLLWQTLKNLGGAIRNIFDAANPATNTFLQMLVDVTGRFKEWTASVEGQNAISEWAFKAVDVMRQFGKTISAVFEVTKELSSSDALISFLKTVESAFDYLGKLPLDKIVAGFVAIAEALQPISGPILAAIIAFASLNILFGNFLGQISGVVAGFDALKGAGAGIANFFKSFGYVGKHSADVSKLSTAFQGLSGILSKGLKVAGIAGLVIWIGSIIAKSDELKAKVGEVFSAIGGVFSSLKGAFSEIGTALAPIGKMLDPLFSGLDKIMAFAIGGALDLIKFGFESLANVIKGAGSVIAGIINIVKGIFTFDFSAIWDGLKQVFSGLGPLLKGAFGLFLTFFAPARFLKLAGGMVKGLAGVLGKGISKAVSAAGKIFGKFAGIILKPLKPIGTFFKTMFDGIINIVTSFSSTVQLVFATVAGIVAQVIGTAVSMFNTLWGSVQVVFNAILSFIVSVGTTIGTVLNGIWDVITTVFTAVWETVTVILTAVWETVSTIFTAIWETISTIVTSIWNTIVNIWNSILSTITSVLNTIKSTMSSAWNFVKTTVSSTFSSIRSTIKSILDTIRGYVDGFVGAVKSAFGTVKDKIGGMFSGVAAAAKGPLNAMIDLLNKALGAINKVIGAANKVPGVNVPKFPKISKLFRGANDFRGGLALVGEQGPELLNLPRGSQVETASRTRSLLGGKTDNSTHVYNITLSMDDLSQLKDLDDFLRMMERARVTSRKTLRSGTVTV